MRILDWFEQFEDVLHLVQSDDFEESFEDLLMEAADSALEIGRSYEALLKKPYEPHALRGIITLKASEDGAAARRGKLAPQTRRILDEMERLIANGHSVTRAAELTTKRGIGTSKDSIRALWYRHAQKKL